MRLIFRVQQCKCSQWPDYIQEPSAGSNKIQFYFLSAPVSVPVHGVRIFALLVWLMSHQPTVLFSHNKSATSNQPAVFISHNKSTPAISHQPNEQVVYRTPPPQKGERHESRSLSGLLIYFNFF
jgi:hypothetical protein